MVVNSVDAASRRVGERPTASLCSGKATRRDAASTVARFKNNTPLSTSTFFRTRTPLSTCFLHLFSFSVLAFALGLSPAHADTKRWLGTDETDPTLASVAANWSPSGVPAATDDVVLDAGSASNPLVWDVPTGVHSWTQTADYTGTVTFKSGRDGIGNKVAYAAVGELDSGGTDKWFKVTADVSLLGGKWTHPAQPSIVDSDAASKNGVGIWRLLIDVGGAMTLGPNASIDATACGFTWSQGPGHSGQSCTTGAAHGGQGAYYTANAKNKCYGNIRTPICHGSGGGWSSGGGSVYLKVKNALTLNGAITVDSAQTSSTYYGASGGSACLVAGSLTGTGSVSATGSPTTSGGGGAGGRIALKLTDAAATFDDFALASVTAIGRGAAHAGTIYLETPTDAAKGGVLWVRGNDAADATMWATRAYLYSTSVDDATQDYTFAEVRLTNRGMIGVHTDLTLAPEAISGDGTGIITFYGGKLQLPEGYAPSNVSIRVFTSSYPYPFTFPTGASSETVSVGSNTELRIDCPLTFPEDLHLYPGGMVSHTAGGSYKLNLTFEKNVYVDKGASINVTSRGYPSDTGPKQGSASSLGVATEMDGGGSHGGLGRKSGTASCYGCVTNPVAHGAGAHQQAPYGGGVALLNIAGTLRVDGAVRADGGAGVYSGGAGGSINIRTARLTGSGSIEANGGRGGDTTWGCGGGGRIAIRLSDGQASFDATPRVFARGGQLGTWQKSAGPGTVYLQTAAQGEGGGTLVIDNDGYTPSYGTAQFGQYVDCEGVGSVVITNCGSLTLTDSKTLSIPGDWRKTSDSSFTANEGTSVILTGVGTSTILGTNNFYNFTCAVPGKTLKFGTTDSCLRIQNGGKLTLTGEADNNLSLVPATATGLWLIYLGLTAAQDIDRVNVYRSDASTSELQPSAKSSVDDGENVNWIISGAVEPGSAIVWTGVSGRQWGMSANWNPERLPVETDVITIPSGTQYSPQLTDDLTLNTLTVQGTLDLNGHGLTVTNDFTCTGTLTADGTESIAVGHALNLSGATLPASIRRVVVGGAPSASADFGSGNFYYGEVGAGSTSVAVTRGGTFGQFVVQPCESVDFSGGVTLNVGEFVASGTDADHLTGLLGASGTWALKVSGSSFVSGVRVSNCNASGGRAVMADSPSTDAGGNSNWTFPTSVVATWTGEVDDDFDTAGNWSSGAVPGAANRVVIPSGMSATARTKEVSIRALEVEGSLHVATNLTVAGSVVIRDGGTVTLDKPATVGGDLTLRGGATLTHSNHVGLSVQKYAIDIEVGGAVEIEANAKIDTTCCGFVGNNGPGRAISCNCGASYGGRAGCWGGNYSTLKPCYGSLFAPTAIGSGGFHGGGVWKAGGAIRICAVGALLNNGDILADGDQNTLSTHYSATGGSIWLTAASFAGSGTVSAIGGRVTEGASGGGGRISLVQTSGTAWEDGYTTKAHGGLKISDTGIKYTPLGAAGTVYRELAAFGAGRGTVVIDNAGAARDTNRGYTELPAGGTGGESAKELARVTAVVKNGGVLGLTSDLTLEELDLQSNGELRLFGHTLTIRSRRHANRKGWKGTVTPAGGTIVWPPRPLCLLVK